MLHQTPGHDAGGAFEFPEGESHRPGFETCQWGLTCPVELETLGWGLAVGKEVSMLSQIPSHKLEHPFRIS